MLQLYFAPGACSIVPPVALEAARAEFEPRLVKLHKGEQKTPVAAALAREHIALDTYKA